MALNVVLIGPPGAGKGTQAERLAARLNVPRISTGDLLREAVTLGTPLGGLVRAVMARGELVGDGVMVDLVRERLDRAGCGGGVRARRVSPHGRAGRGPRAAWSAGRGPLAVVEILVPEDELVRRLGARLVCGACGVNAAPGTGAGGRCGRCGGALVQRADDGAEVVRERLRVFARDRAAAGRVLPQPRAAPRGGRDTDARRGVRRAGAGGGGGGPVIVCKSPAEIERMRPANVLVADVLVELRGVVGPGRHDGRSRCLRRAARAGRRAACRRSRATTGSPRRSASR